MRKIITFIIVFMALLKNSVVAQDLITAQKWIKAGNSLREAHQYEQGENYLLKGLKAIRQLQNKYWEAVASEYLGLLYASTDDDAQANQYFNYALRYYKAQNLSLSFNALKSIMNDRDVATDDVWQYYGGIDVGSKGVKYSIIKVRRREGHFNFVSLKDGSKNTQIVDFSSNAVEETSDAVKAYLDTISSYNGSIKPENIFIAVSSGVKQEADKQNNREEMLRTALKKTIPDYAKKIEFLDACTEGDLTIKGILPSDYLYISSLIDVGSGNTKGGYRMKDTKVADCFSIPWGTSTLTKRLNGIPLESVQQFFIDSIKKVYVAPEIARKAGLTNRKYIFLVGGIYWAISNYLYPGKIKEDFTELTAQDVNRFLYAAMNDYQSLIKPDLSGITSMAELTEATKQIERTRTTFTQDNIIAGALLVKSIVDESQRIGVKDKHFIFSRYGYVGWISGYIVKKIDDDFNKMNEVGAQ